MILQANKPIKVFGTGEGIGKVEFLGETSEFVSDGLNWCVTLGIYPYGGPYEMKVTMNGETVTVSDIYVGEVWIAGGQSNMALHLFETVNGMLDIQLSDSNDEIRYFTPVQGFGDLHFGEWNDVSDGCVSAVAYYTAKCLNRILGVHVGIIECNKGFTSSFHWIPRDVIDENEITAAIASSKDDVLAKKIKVEDSRCFVMGYSYDLPYGYFFDQQIRAISPYSVQGVLWYQGETDAFEEEAAEIYKISFGMVVSTWRKYLQNEDMLFITTLLPNFGEKRERAWSYIRQAQVECADKIKNVCFVSAVDRGQANNIHPSEKRYVGERMAACALNKVYGKDIRWKSPTLKNIEQADGKLLIYFNDTYGKLFEDCGIYDDFDIYMRSGEHRKLKGNVVEDHVELDAEDVKIVAYAFENNPYIRIFNKYGLPLVPFYKEL